MLDATGLTRASVRKEKHARSSNKKGHVLVHLRQFEDENPKQPINLKLFESENADKIKKDIEWEYHMQSSKCLRAFGALPQQTLKSACLVQVQGSAYPHKYHYQPDYGRF